MAATAEWHDPHPVDEPEAIVRGAGWSLINATKIAQRGVNPSGGPSPVPESKETNRHAS